MSTMLRTTNPQAAGEADHDRRRPYVGQAVRFHPRPGEGHRQRQLAPAIVANVEDDDHLELIVFWDAEDIQLKWKIPRKTDQNNVHCWSFNEYDEKHYLRAEAAPPPVQHDGIDLYSEVGELRRRVTELESAKRPKPRAVD